MIVDKETFETLKEHCVNVAAAGNYWWRLGYPAIAEKLMLTNLMMLEILVPPGQEDWEAKLGLLEMLRKIRVELGKEDEDEPPQTRKPH
jgi:hypothetical protein